MSTLSIQLSELEMLQSMFSPTELRLEPSLLDDMKSSIEYGCESTPLVTFTLNLDVEIKMEVSVTLSIDYPTVGPEIFVRSESLDKHQSASLHKELQDYINTLERGEVCIYSAISWLQENSHKYKPDEKIVKKSHSTTDDNLVRLWIYSHHIYNKEKRRNILSAATDHCCTGFMLPGRPGIICLEGFDEDCDQVWKKIRSMNWKKIMLKTKEECLQRSFPKFEETSFNKCKDERHMDMGEFFKYLESHNCGYIFKEYFGVDGKISTDD